MPKTLLNGLLCYPYGMHIVNDKEALRPWSFSTLTVLYTLLLYTFVFILLIYMNFEGFFFLSRFIQKGPFYLFENIKRQRFCLIKKVWFIQLTKFNNNQTELVHPAVLFSLDFRMSRRIVETTHTQKKKREKKAVITLAADLLPKFLYWLISVFSKSLNECIWIHCLLHNY